MLTLRQIEVVRAIMIAGTVKGAAELLGVSAPGISRVMKHTESQLGLRLFVRTHGRYVPTEEAKEIFDQISDVFRSVGNLQFALTALKAGDTKAVSFAAVPSIANHVFPVAIKRLRERFPALPLRLNMLKIEEAIDYLLLNKGEMVALSYKLDHPNLSMQPLYSGRLVAIVPLDHPLAAKQAISLHDLVREPMVGIDPNDPYGGILSIPFRDEKLSFDFSIQARTGQMIAALVAQGLGVAVIDELSIAGPARQPDVAVRPIVEPTSFRAFAAFNAQRPRSIFADALVGFLKAEMQNIASTTPERP
ncbi:MAG: LysR family transcriptional regulator [Pseudomonadota bacterium]